eukprot:1714373-Alexandrium_andersonii.AAC.1
MCRLHCLYGGSLADLIVVLCVIWSRCALRSSFQTQVSNNHCTGMLPILTERPISSIATHVHCSVHSRRLRFQARAWNGERACLSVAPMLPCARIDVSSHA